MPPSFLESPRIIECTNIKMIVTGCLMVPDGRYPGVHHGYRVSWEYNGAEYEAASPDLGIRGWKNVEVIVKNGRVSIEA